MKKKGSLTEGAVFSGMLRFMFPLMLGQLLQQLYNLADAWVIGNYADNASFAAVSAGGSLSFLIVGFFNGIATGGGVVISRYYGAKDWENVEKAIHTNLLFGLIASIVTTILTVAFVPVILKWMQTPDTVLPYSISYFRIYFAGVSMIILYNIFMAIMRAQGDSIHPLYYLMISTAINIGLDLLFVAKFHWGVKGAAFATVIAQGISAALCLGRLVKSEDQFTKIHWSKLKLDADMMGQVIRQGLPSGVQNSALSIGNMVVQTQINTFGEFAMAGMGSSARIEGFVFIPVVSMSMTLSTYVSQNLGAKKPERAKKGALMGTLFSMCIAQIIGIFFYCYAPLLNSLFIAVPEALKYSVIQTRTVTLFYFLLAFSHCASGIMIGCGRSMVSMATMLSIWCGIRILYVTTALHISHSYHLISKAYPLTWSLSTIVFLIFLWKNDWKFRQRQHAAS